MTEKGTSRIEETLDFCLIDRSFFTLVVEFTAARHSPALSGEFYRGSTHSARSNACPATENPHDIQMALLRAMGGSHFDIYLDEIQSRFFQRGLINSTGWLATKTLTSRLPAPNFSLSQTLLISEFSPDPREHLLLKNFGQLLTQKYKSDLQRNRTLLPHRFENDCGKAILESIHVSPEEVRPKQNEQAEQVYGSAYQKLKGQNSCETYLFDYLFNQMKNSFVNE